MKDDRPTVPPNSEVIALADVRLARGITKYSPDKCKHRSLVYNETERRIWCEDCERTIEGFDAFMTVVRSFSDMLDEARRFHREAAEARGSVIHRIAAKELARQWSGRVMAVSCPHCRRGILPEDVPHMGATSREIEIAYRKKRNRETSQDQTNKDRDDG